MERVALIIGVTGSVGGPMAEYFSKKGNWKKIYGVSRQKPNFLAKGVEHIPCDLLDREDVKVKLGSLQGVTHVFCAALPDAPSEAENIKAQREMTKNLLESVSKPALQHFALVCGSKYYGGPFESWATCPMEFPFKETAERLPVPNFYYVQEDLLFEYAARMKYSWTSTRPSIVSSFCPTGILSITSSIAVYAAICKHTGQPFVYPGSAEGFDQFVDITDGELLAKHLDWQINTPEAKNQAFNAVNGDIFTWRQVWPQFAAYFGLKDAPYEGKVVDFYAYVEEKSEVWDAIVKKHQLRGYKLKDIFKPQFTDWCFTLNSHIFSDMNKSRDMGFAGTVNTMKSFLRVFDRLQNEKVVPTSK